MQRILCALPSLGLLLPSVESLGQSDNFLPIESEADFFSLVVGKKLTRINSSSEAILNANGTLTGTGTGGGGSFSGTWYWDAKYFCRELDLSGDAGRLDCQTVEFDGKLVRFTIDRGKGEARVWKLP